MKVVMTEGHGAGGGASDQVRKLGKTCRGDELLAEFKREREDRQAKRGRSLVPETTES